MSATRLNPFKPVMLALAVSTLMYSAVMPQAVANDLDIYRPATAGQITLVLMLDTSGSMGTGSINEDYPGVCGTIRTENSGTTPNYVRSYCQTSTGKYYDRLSRLKDAIFALMDDNSPQLDPTRVLIGLAQFSTQSDSSNIAISADGRSGKIVVKAAPIGAVGSTQRADIKKFVAAFVAGSFTPTANAYAEAGAYLMGTTTNTTDTIDVANIVYRRYMGDGRNPVFTNQTWTCNSPNQNPAMYNTTAGERLLRLCSNYGTFSSTSNHRGTGIVGSVNLRDGDGDIYAYYFAGTSAYPVSNYSGFSRSVTASKLPNNYNTPLPTTVTECDGQGIYFLTDGEPNSAPAPLPLMQAASKNTFSYTDSNALPSGSSSGNGMPEVGAFAKFLFNKDQNPAKASIKTAVVGYGSVFEDLKDKKISLTEVKIDPKTGAKTETIRDYYQCHLSASVDARNACNWGEKSNPNLKDAAGKPVGGYGEGGFYYASSKESVVESIKSFILELDNKIEAVPAGAAVVPQDTLAPDSLRPYAYLPLLQPEPGKEVVAWAGNLKKYDVKNRTFFGGNGKLVFDSEGGFATDTYDLWATDKDAKGNAVSDKGLVGKGGVVANLPMPTTDNQLQRNVWLEVTAGNKTLSPVRPVLSEIQALGGTNITNLQRRYLLNFLGYDVPEVGVFGNPTSLADAANVLKASDLTRPPTRLPVMGGVVHSTPQILTYSADLNSNGTLSDKRDEAILFGSFEGALHIVDTETGVEKMAFIPRSMLDNQPRALKPGTTGKLSFVTGTTGTPTAFGVDAPWAAYAEYSRTATQIKADLMYAYGGLRLGGNAFYGLDLTSPTTPKVLFSLTPSTAGFARLGQAWGKPVITRVRFDNKTRTVVIISGGYDADYEKTDPNRSVSTPVQGNAVYMLDAKTGELLLSIGKSTSEVPSVGGSANLVDQSITHSIVGRVKVLDRDADGLSDHLYFADLGGQLFRVDLQNAPNTPTAQFGTRVVRVANLTSDINGSGLGARFYEAPIVTLQEEDGQSFALINIGSGDRSNPLYTNTGKASTDNRIYGIIDRDVVRVDLYSSKVTMVSKDIGLADDGLIDASKKISAADKTSVKVELLNGSKNGWYYPLNEYGTDTAVRGLKAINDGVAIGNDLYMAVYNPSVRNNRKNPCSAQVLGATELHRYCLPFGVCLSPEEGDRQRFPLGQGTQGPVIVPDGENSRTLGYSKETDEVKDLRNPTAEDQHRRYTTPPRLVPIRWYEKQPKIKFE